MRFLQPNYFDFLLFLTNVLAAQGVGSDLFSLARLTGQGVTVKAHWRSLDLKIEMTRPVPWRVFTLEEPRRLFIDFSELDWSGIDRDAILYESEKVSDLCAGFFRPGWTRLVLDLAEPLALTQAGMTTESDGATLTLSLVSVSSAEFSETAGAPKAENLGNPIPVTASGKTRQRGEGPLVVVLDPGHGGIDPGAERDGVVEADLMLAFARELSDVLVRSGGFKIMLTRDDGFVSLEERVTIARGAVADAFMSLHADALAQGRATGATVYILPREASDVASQKLAERLRK